MASVGDVPASVEILTINCWGLKFLSKFRNARLTEIGRRISESSPAPQIVGLQECWTQADYRSIRDQTRHILPYGKFYYSGVFGGGLAVLSKWPIEETSMFRYPLNGRPTAFFRGDWFVGKGVACARIRIGHGVKDVAEVFCTHLHAPYEREPHDSYLCHRTAQAWEIAKLMRGAAERGHLIIGLGDFNMVPLSLAHQIITTHALAQDAWRVLHPDSSIGAAIDQVEVQRGRATPSIDYNLLENGATCDSALNTWRWDKAERNQLNKGSTITVDESSKDPYAKRLDYVFIGTPQPVPTLDKAATSSWHVFGARVGMIERHPTLQCSLSDHFSVEVTLQRREAAQTIKREEDQVQRESSPFPPLLAPVLEQTTYDDILSIISTYSIRERGQRRLRLCHMLVQTIISIGCFVAVWWSPHNYVAFILIILSTFGFTFGIIDGLIGGLFVGSELRALKEFEWEIRNAKRAAARLPGKDHVKDEALQDY